MRILNDNLLELKKTYKEILEKISMLSDEVQNFASKREVVTLQRYVDFWQPMDFVTRKEVNDFLRKKFHSKKVEEKKEVKTTKKTVSIEDAYPDTY